MKPLSPCRVDSHKARVSSNDMEESQICTVEKKEFNIREDGLLHIISETCKKTKKQTNRVYLIESSEGCPQGRGTGRNSQCFAESCDAVS